jgi:hypothetical protein
VDGDKGNNVLFDTDVKTITDQLWKLEKEGKPPVACYSDQTVLSNHHYNVRGYEGLNICWVYNMRARGWEGRLTKGVQEALFPKDYPRGPRAGSFERFPHFRTFYEDVPRVIKLRADQVNAFANFTSWLVTDERSACHMKATLKVNLPQPPGVVCVTK